LSLLSVFSHVLFAALPRHSDGAGLFVSISLSVLAKRSARADLVPLSQRIIQFAAPIEILQKQAGLAGVLPVNHRQLTIW